MSKLFGFFKIVIAWENECFVHVAKNQKEVLEWMKCYPADATCWARNWWGFGEVVAARGE